MENENKNEELEKVDLPEEESEVETPAPVDYPAEILNLIRSTEDDAALREALGDYHENDIAAAMGEMTPEERERLLGVLGNEAMSEVLAYSEDAGEYLEEMDAGVAASLSDVCAVELDNTPGAAADMVSLFAREGLSLAYLYTFLYKERPVMVFRTDDAAKAKTILESGGLCCFNW